MAGQELLVREAETLVTRDGDGRTRPMTIGGQQVLAVVGQDFNKTEPTGRAPLVGVLTGPCAGPPNMYTNSIENVREGIKNRLTLKQKNCTWKKGGLEYKRVGRMVRGIIAAKGPLSEKKVMAWLNTHPILSDLRSKKWSEERATRQIEQLCQTVDPSFKLSTAVKVENMPEGKAPRFLIADGDAGQVMALLAVKCLEELLFEHNEIHSIKHAGKRKAMERLVKGYSSIPEWRVRDHGATFLEGDGSAWDTTCNETVRGLIENPILEHIGRIIAVTTLIPESWNKAHEEVNSRSMLKLFFSKNGQFFKEAIKAIRRSGHRGTSVLNYLINWVMTICSLFVEPERFIDPDVRVSTDVAGVKRWFYGGWEGDDSGSQTSPKLIMLSEDARRKLDSGALTYADFVDKDKLITENVVKASHLALNFWSDAGFHMKFVFACKRATMVGWHLHLRTTEDGSTVPSGIMAPELPRALKMNVTTSRVCVDALESGDLKGFTMVASAANLARAADFAGIVPSVSKKYLEYADRLNSTNYVDRELGMRVNGEEGVSADSVRDEINIRNSAISPSMEEEICRKLGYDYTSDELLAFNTRLWTLETAWDYEGYSASLPAAWKVGDSI